MDPGVSETAFRAWHLADDLGLSYCMGFPSLLLTSYHKFSGLSNTNLFSPSYGGQKSNAGLVWLKSGGQQGCSLQRLQKSLFLLLPNSGGCRGSLACGCIAPTSASVVTWPPSFLSVPNLPQPPSYEDPMITLGNLERSHHLKILKLITPAKFFCCVRSRIYRF